MAREHPTNQYNHKVQNGEKIGKKTFCLVLLNEEMALLKLVTLRSEESSPNSVAAIFAINSSGSGRHLGAKRYVLNIIWKKGIVKAPCVCHMATDELEEGQLVLMVVNHQLHHIPGWGHQI